MACVLTTGYNLDCKDGVGGVKDIWVITSANKGTLTKTASGTVSAWTPVANSLFKYQLPKHTASFDPEIVADVQAGTLHYPGQLTIDLRKMDVSKRNELKLLAAATLMIIVKDKNGIYWLIGEDNGADLTEAKGSTGVQMGDFNGWKLTFTWDDGDMPLTLEAAVITALGI